MEYLDSIVNDVRRRLEQRREAVPLYRLRALAAPPNRPSFAQALRGPGLALIAEVKRASPSRGPLRPDLDVHDLVARYEAAGAAAISVLTEEDHFRGHLDDLSAAVGGTSLPILQKDFILDEYQLHEARALGASAVLLIVAILDHDELLALGETARRLGLDVVAEVHDEVELEQALLLDEAIVGINSRDLRTFEISLETIFKLVSQVPPQRKVIGESGVRGREEFLRLEAAGVDGVLVGEHLLAQEDVEAAIRELLYK
jgi:indole-3-glycerol phosphate synthase